jgi:4-hydroxy-2-oxoheptanedioate aldolase
MAWKAFRLPGRAFDQHHLRTDMRPNRIRELWEADQPVLNGWLAIPHSFSAEVMAHQGFDSVTMDLQHGMIDYSDAPPILAAISTTSSMPMCRVPWNDPALLMKMLDAGCYGVICPMVNSVEEAQRLVEATRYPPIGQRSFGPIRASLYGGSDYGQKANETVVILAMVETRAALESVEQIVAVEGLDGVYVGPNDLALSLGLHAHFDSEEPLMLEALDRIIQAARSQGKQAGIHCGSVSYAKRMIEQGFRLVTVGSDARFISQGATQVLQDFRSDASGKALAY